jgi:hypothetical protein
MKKDTSSHIKKPLYTGLFKLKDDLKSSKKSTEKDKNGKKSTEKDKNGKKSTEKDKNLTNIY